jgi:hypothetical protein
MRLSQEGSDGLAYVTRMGEWEMHTTVHSEGVMEMSLLRDCVCGWGEENIIKMDFK